MEIIECCPSNLKGLIESCYDNEKSSRPTFSMIVDKFKNHNVSFLEEKEEEEEQVKEEKDKTINLQ